MIIFGRPAGRPASLTFSLLPMKAAILIFAGPFFDVFSRFVVLIFFCARAPGPSQKESTAKNVAGD